MTEPLDRIADIIVGYQAKSRLQEKQDGLFRIIQGKDFQGASWLKADTLLSFAPERNPAPYVVHERDVLFQARGTEHFAYCLEKELVNTLASSSFYIVRLKTEKVMPQYLAWWLNQKVAQAYFNVHASSTAISFISKHVLLQLELEMPAIITQKKICQAIKLWQQEKNLRNELAKKRSRLINELCLNAAQQQERYRK